MSSLTKEQICHNLEANKLTEVTQSAVELKSTWQQANGKDISAIANQLGNQGGWLIVGVDDTGLGLNKDHNWLTTTEQQVRGHINQYLSPTWAAVVHGVKLSCGHVLLIEIQNPGDVVYWNDKAYKLVGTSSIEMKPDEVLYLSMQLPGADYSKTQNANPVDSAKVMEFAKTLQHVWEEEKVDLQSVSSKFVLSKLGIENTTAAAILFGEFKFRVVHYNTDGDILDQREEKGLFSLLTDKFVDEIQSWTRKQSSNVVTNTTFATEEQPYTPAVLREVLANAVAHSLYQREEGNVLIELYPGRIAVTNNCALDAKLFVNKWFSRINKVHNKVLMNLLRLSRIVDELGSGKNRIFRLTIENGKREPPIEFRELGNYARWSITLYNDQSNESLLALIERLKITFDSADEWRIATALLLWKDRPLPQIVDSLDTHYRQVAQNVLGNKSSPVFLVGDKLVVRRWARVALDGQISRKFNAAEEEQLKKFLQDYTYRNDRNGYITSEEAREVLGLSNQQSEVVQLSNLFRKWKTDGAVASVKRGTWRFIRQTAFEDVFSKLVQYAEQNEKSKPRT